MAITIIFSFTFHGIPIFQPSEGNKNWFEELVVQEIRGKITVFDWLEGTTLGLELSEVQKMNGSRNGDSTVNDKWSLWITQIIKH